MSHFGVLSFLFLKNYPIVIHRKNNNIQVWNYMRVNNHWIFYFFGGKLFLYTWHLKGTHTLFQHLIHGSLLAQCLTAVTLPFRCIIKLQRKREREKYWQGYGKNKDAERVCMCSWRDEDRGGGGGERGEIPGLSVTPCGHLSALLFSSSFHPVPVTFTGEATAEMMNGIRDRREDKD